MKYFGTDGIREKIDKFSPRFLKKIATALVKFYNKHNLKRVLLVGNDSRLSSDYMLASISSVILRSGIEIHNVGVCSSPALAFITRKNNYPLSMMISASHNPSEYNGIKFFNSQGEKISELREREIEDYIDKSHISKTAVYSHIKDKHTLIDEYINYLKEIKIKSVPCIIDCSNGGGSEIVNRVFPLNKKINSRPDGNNINKNAGCTHIEQLRLECMKHHTIGFALDGDGDRVGMISESGRVVTGDGLLYLLAKSYLNSGDTLVGTIYTNSALEHALRKRNIELVRTNVGDRNVYQKMQKLSSTLGGENAGHIIFKKYSNTGDGILIAILILNLIATSKMTLDELISEYQEYYQAMDNISLADDFHVGKETFDLIAEYEKSGYKIIIRPSGTEPVLRIMVEEKNEENAKNCLNFIKNHIKDAKK